MPQDAMNDFLAGSTSEVLLLLRLTLGICFFAFTVATIYFTTIRLEIEDALRRPLIWGILASVVGILFYAHLYFLFEAPLKELTTSTDAGEDLWSAMYFDQVLRRYSAWFVVIPLLLWQMASLIPNTPQRRSMTLTLTSLSLLMLLCGYFGEMVTGNTRTHLLWGTAATIAYVGIVYLLFTRLVRSATVLNSSPALARCKRTLPLFVVTGWGVYPIGYVVTSLMHEGDLRLVFQIAYNLADLINIIGPCIVISWAAGHDSESPTDRSSLSNERLAT